jgi:hypothetical protein
LAKGSDNKSPTFTTNWEELATARWCKHTDTMTTFNELYGAVYILENGEAQRVKVGMTINDIEGRLEDINYMWNSTSRD